jgi:DNA-binding winged helix-turn-helix (wHTH) protein
VLLRRRWLLADGVAVELGARAFDLLLVLLEADGALVTKEELLNRVWPGIVASKENLKVQISALRKALGADRNLIRTEFGRGYRLAYCARTPPHMPAEAPFARGGDLESAPVECRATVVRLLADPTG